MVRSIAHRRFKIGITAGHCGIAMAFRRVHSHLSLASNPISQVTSFRTMPRPESHVRRPKKPRDVEGVERSRANAAVRPRMPMRSRMDHPTPINRSSQYAATSVALVSWRVRWKYHQFSPRPKMHSKWSVRGLIFDQTVGARVRRTRKFYRVRNAKHSSPLTRIEQSLVRKLGR